MRSRTIFVERFEMRTLACSVTNHFLGQGVGQLQHLDVVEGLLEDDEIVVHAEADRHLFPRVIGVSGADDDLQGGIDLPEPFDRLDAVPARRHAHVDKSHGVGLPVFQRLRDLVQRLLALIGGLQLEGAVTVTGVRGVSKSTDSIASSSVRLREEPSRILRKSSWMAGLSSTSKMRLLSGKVHEEECGVARGSSKMKVAPRPGTIAMSKESATHLLRGEGGAVQPETVAVPARGEAV